MTTASDELTLQLHQAMEADFQAEKARKLKNFQYLNQYIKKRPDPLYRFLPDGALPGS